MIKKSKNTLSLISNTLIIFGSLFLFGMSLTYHCSNINHESWTIISKYTPLIIFCYIFNIIQIPISICSIVFAIRKQTKKMVNYLIASTYLYLPTYFGMLLALVMFGGYANYKIICYSLVAVFTLAMIFNVVAVMSYININNQKIANDLFSISLLDKVPLIKEIQVKQKQNIFNINYLILVIFTLVSIPLGAINGIYYMFFDFEYLYLISIYVIYLLPLLLLIKKNSIKDNQVIFTNKIMICKRNYSDFKYCYSVKDTFMESIDKYLIFTTFEINNESLIGKKELYKLLNSKPNDWFTAIIK